MTRFINNPYAEDIITKLAQDEVGKRQYYRPVYSLHKWWARRPGALFRSITLLAAKPELSATLFHRVGNDGLAPDSPYFQGHDLSDFIILDPFMGDGTTLVEANRMGAKVIGGDINPVSYWIVRETLKPLDLEKLQEYFQTLEQTAGTRIRALYSTTCTVCGAAADGLYNFWVRYVPCPECGERVYLFKHHLLNKGFIRSKGVSVSNPAMIVCPLCHTVNESPAVESCRCKTCDTEFDPQKGSFNQGRSSCPHCGTRKISLIETVRRGTNPIEQTTALYEQVAAATRDKLSYEATHARLNENKLFLYYMGETLKVMSELPTTRAASCELFSDLLQQYRRLLDEVEELLVPPDRSADTLTRRKQALEEQLRLFEATVCYNMAET